MVEGIYVGVLAHARIKPRAHSFAYNVFMVCCDVQRVGEFCARSRWWSDKKRWWPAAFVREDFHGRGPLYEAVAETVKAKAGRYPTGKIFMLANWRYWGVNFNPLTVYYCFDEGCDNPSFLVAEVTNTPWRERFAYVIRCDPTCAHQQVEFAKKLHVSPFNDLSMCYRWQSETPGQSLSILLENFKQSEKVFSASLQLKRRELNGGNLRRILIEFPVMTVKVLAGIHWQALLLWLKRIPVYNHN